MRYLLPFILLLLGSSLPAQEKLEREFRVEAEVVPPAAKNWLEQAFPKTRKLKWFFEETSGQQSYEAKFCYKRQKYSVEFALDGSLEDVEIEWRWKKIPRKKRETLKKAFTKISGFKLQRIQEQWTGLKAAIEKSIQEREPQGVMVRYEVEFLGKMDDQKALWEGTFSEEGVLLSYRKVILSTTDNLDF